MLCTSYYGVLILRKKLILNQEYFQFMDFFLAPIWFHAKSFLHFYQFFHSRLFLRHFDFTKITKFWLINSISRKFFCWIFAHYFQTVCTKVSENRGLWDFFFEVVKMLLKGFDMGRQQFGKVDLNTLFVASSYPHSFTTWNTINV